MCGKTPKDSLKKQFFDLKLEWLYVQGHIYAGVA